ncbi:MAG: hypothetical protein WC752_01650 [Patescibacteria group bacterium]|jgi:hypothetical protein
MKKILIAFLFFIFPVILFAQEEISLSEFVKYTGEADGDAAGFDVATAGDVNGDGYDDFLVGASMWDADDIGAVYLTYGQSSGLTGDSLSTAVRFEGEGPNYYAGASVSTAGDVNNDGYDDIIIGSYGYGANGAAYLIYGQAEYLTSASLSTAVVFTGEVAGDLAGISASFAGDVNNDGYDDFLVGARNYDVAAWGDNGAAYLIYGQSSNLSGGSLGTEAVRFNGETDNNYDYAGFAVSGAGDVNGDGYDDFLVGAMEYGASQAGAAYLIYGQSENLTNASLSTKVRFTGEANFDYAGITVSGAGDVNNDGYDDFLVGANEYGDSGAAYLLYGQSENFISASLSTAVKFTGETALDQAGRGLSRAGDVNNDGYDDFLIGAIYNDDGVSQAGSAYLIYGQITNYTSQDLSFADQFTGENSNDGAGWAISSAGDVNNDGNDDILVGAYYYSTIDNGVAYLGYLNIDKDGDGVTSADGIFAGTDCNDSDNTVSANQTYYVDSDGDGYGSTQTASLCSSTAPVGYSTNSTDCSDTDSTVHENQTYYQDPDGDGFGDPDTDAVSCSLTPPIGYVANDDEDDVNTNGAPDAFENLDPTNTTVVASVITAVEGYQNGQIKVTYANSSIYYYTIYSNLTTTKLTKVKQYKKTGYYLVLQPKGKKLALVNVLNGAVKDRKTLSKKIGYKYNALKVFKIRKKKLAVVASRKHSNNRLSILKVNISKKKLIKKDYKTFKNKNTAVAKTKKSRNNILLLNKKAKTIKKYFVTKKFLLRHL